MSTSFPDPCVASMPLTNSIKDLLLRYNNPPSILLTILVQLTSPQNNARFFMGHLNLLKTVFANYFWSIAMFPSKCFNLTLSVPGFKSVSRTPTCQFIRIYMM